MSLLMTTIFPCPGEPTLGLLESGITLLRPAGEMRHAVIQFKSLGEFDGWLGKVVSARSALFVTWDDQPDDDNLAFPNDDLNDRGDGIERIHPEPVDPGVAGLSMETVALLVGLPGMGAEVDRAVEMEREET